MALRATERGERIAELRTIFRMRERAVERERDAHPAFCHDANPSLDRIAYSLLAASGRFIQFRYDTLAECRRPMTPSKAAAQADTLMVGPLDEAKGYAGGPEGGGVRVTKDGNWIITLLTMNRRKRLPRGEGYFADKDQGSYQWRSYRLEGIRLETVEANMGGRMGKVRIFPAVVPVDNAYVELAEMAI